MQELGYVSESMDNFNINKNVPPDIIYFLIWCSKYYTPTPHEGLLKKEKGKQWS